MDRLSRVLYAFGSIGLATALCLVVYPRIQPSGPPRAVADDPDQRVVSKWPPQEIVATYYVTNRGGSDLVLGEVAASCGCTAAKVEPHVVSPGHRAIVTARAMPPSAGMTPVTLRIPTNEVGRRELDLRLTLVGSAPPPFVAAHNGPVSLGRIRRDSPPVYLWIETREKRSARPWMGKVSSSLSFLQVGGGPVRERPLGNDVILRRYEYEIKVREIPPPGERVGQIDCWSSLGDTKIAFTVPVHGFVPFPVTATPRVLSGSFDSTENPRLLVTLTADEQDFQLRVTPSDRTTSTLELRSVEMRANRVVFAVSPRPGVRWPVLGAVIFETNHPGQPSVEVPIALRSRDSHRPQNPQTQAISQPKQ